MITQRDWKRLVRYVTGELEPDEAEVVRSWAASSPRRSALLQAVEDLWEETEGLDSDMPVWDVNRAWAELEPRLESSEGAPERKVIRLVPRVSLTRKIGRVAAGVVGIAATVAMAILGFRAFQVLHENDGQNLVAFEALPGQRKTIRLSDRTRVVLASDSRLIVPRRFRDKRRSVELVGEAFFDVTPSENRPFFVDAGHVETKVLGTAFDVRAYPGTASVDVFVSEGSVQVARRTGPVARSVVLEAGQVAMVPLEGETRVARADVSRYLAWTEGRLVFDGDRLDHVLSELERWYGVPFALASPELSSRSFTATFEGETLQEVADVVAAALELRYTVKADTVIFESRVPNR